MQAFLIRLERLDNSSALPDALPGPPPHNLAVLTRATATFDATRSLGATSMPLCYDYVTSGAI